MADGRVVRPQFTASAGEYFRIWIVNLFFTLVTLGIYSAWAKVRKKRYFYGSTRFDGDSFDYFASPKVILKGRIIAVGIFVVYALLGELYPVSNYFFWGVAALALPWLVLRALTFNARNSAWRGLRFDFSGQGKEAAKLYFGMSLLVIVTFGFAWPLFVARYKQFVLSHHRLGTTPVTCRIPDGRFFLIYLKATLMFLAAIVPIGVLAWFLLPKLYRMDIPEWAGWAMVIVPMLVMYAVYSVIYAYTQARTANLIWSNTSAPGIRFESTLSAKALCKLYLSNVLAVAFTAGLLIPWAVVRTLRYRLENFAMVVDGEPVHHASPTLERVGAAGQELGDIFNLELGL